MFTVIKFQAYYCKPVKILDKYRDFNFIDLEYHFTVYDFSVEVKVSLSLYT